MLYADRSSLKKLVDALDSGGVKEGDLLVEVGYATFSGAYAASTRMPIVTKLSTIVYGTASAFGAYSIATDANEEKKYLVFVDPTVTQDTDSHRKTFYVYRSSQGALSGLKICYVVVGKLFSTEV